MNRINTCGMGCPQPVLMTKKALKDDPKGIDVIVGSTTAKDNVERFLIQLGYTVALETEDDNVVICARK